MYTLESIYSSNRKIVGIIYVIYEAEGWTRGPILSIPLCPEICHGSRIEFSCTYRVIIYSEYNTNIYI